MMFKLAESDDQNEKTKHVGYADDLTGAGKLRSLRSWFDTIVSCGPSYG